MQTQKTGAIEESTQAPRRGNPLEVLAVFTRLGLTSFGGPVAQLGYFREDIVLRRKWVYEKTYGDLIGLCQFLPGPASSQVGISLGIMRAGLPGGLAAWIGFTLPSAILMTVFAYTTSIFHISTSTGWLHGLMVVAVAVVAQAVWGMARNLTPDRPRATLAILAAIATLLWASGIGQVVIIVAAGLVGWIFLRKVGADSSSTSTSAALEVPIPRALAISSLMLFFALLIALPLLALVLPAHALALFASFYRSGALVFGGGHVVLPLLQSTVVAPGWVTTGQFLSGYGAAQAAPSKFP